MSFGLSQTSGQQGQALPLAKTGTGPDFVYTDGSNLYGVSYDNGVMWQQSMQGQPWLGNFSQAAADETGDFVIPGADPVSYALTMTKFYGTNGLPEWTHSFDPSTVGWTSAVDSQGNVFLAITSAQSGLMELASSSGQAVLLQPFSLAADESSPFAIDQVSVLSDGSVQVQYEDVLYTNIYAVSVHLATSSPSSGSATDTVLDSTVQPAFSCSGVGQVYAHAGLSFPDGNGGTANLWQETDCEGISGTVFISDSTTDITFQSSQALLGNDFEAGGVLGSTGLLYLPATQMNCTAGPCGPTLIAMNLATGTEAWRIPIQEPGYYPNWSGIPYNTLAAATSDGGVAITGPGGVARIDTNGNVTPDSDLSPYEGTSGGFLSYLGGPDGTLWATSASDAVVSDSADLESTDGTVVSDWLAPSGTKNAHRAAKSAQFMDSDTKYHCGGFDGNFNPHILVVPVNGTNQVLLQVKGAWQNVTLQSDTTSVTVSPPAPTGNKTVLTVSGGPTAVLARIKVINSNGSHMATLRVAVQNQIQPPTTLDLYPVTEADENLVGVAPNTTDVLNELQITFGKHANLAFTVNGEATISVAYDLNNDEALQAPATNNNYSEASAIVTYITNNNGVLGDIWASYVYDINPHTVEGFTSSLGGKAEFIRNNTTPPPNGQPWVTAHETGHALGLEHPEDYLQNKYHDVQDVMTKYDPGTGPCRLHVDQWDQLNPTGSNQNLTQWELAPWQHPADD